MFAPSAFRATRALLVILTGTLLLAGCSAPGLGRLQERPPRDLPAVMELVSAEAMGFALHDADPTSARWRAIDAATGVDAARRALTRLHAPLAAGAVDLDDVGEWVGPAAGRLLYLLATEAEGPLPEASSYFATVADRPALEAWLAAQGWTRDEAVDAKLPQPDLAAWTRAGAGAARYGALALRDDALVAARDVEGLTILLTAADRYAISERKAMADGTVEALRTSPMSIVFRGDATARQLRRSQQDDPARRELMRWATASKLIDALRDGWIGIEPGTGNRDGALRVVASADWLASLAPRFTLERADRSLLATLSPEVTHAVAVHDPGALAADLVNGITLNRLQYATDADRPEGEERVSLLDVLGRLDGDAVLGLDARQRQLHAVIETDEPAEARAGLQTALRLADVLGSVYGEDEVRATVSLGQAGRISQTFRPEDAAAAHAQELDAAFATTGAPPAGLEPVAWLWAAPDACAGRAAGWLAFDGTIELRGALDVELRGRGRCSGASLLDRLFPPAD